MIRKRLIRSLVAVGATAALVVVGGGTAKAAMLDPTGAGITLGTTINFHHSAFGDSVVITADGTFTSSFIENTTIALEAVGTQAWTDTTGNKHVAPIDCAQSGIQFATTNHVECDISLEPNAIVSVSYTAEDVGLAPSPFTGSCFGTGVQLSDTSNLTDNDC